MKKATILLPLIALIFWTAYKPVNQSKYDPQKATDANGYSYQYFTNDPSGVRIYTLKNGLTVYLSVNKEAPRINTEIGVKAGSTYDPAQTTGLAHYLEHMMFKGTDKLGTTNWTEESKLLQQISDLYELHMKTNDPAEKKRIYAKIDSVSYKAAQYAVPNEYDKMVSSMGAKETNAYTTFERTVYVNDIPANELERWLDIESERFGKLVLRLFHTELEAVYEEFNISQDNDFRKKFYAMLGALFQKHPYGTQTTIGTAEHLKNPSMVNIHNYWNTYYVPNNMAIALSGDLDFDQTIKLIDKYFGKYQSKSVPEYKHPVEEPITAPIVKEVTGPQAEDLMMGFRFGGVNSADRKFVTLIDMLLSNRTAGLIDLNLVQQQKVLSASCSPMFMSNYGVHYFSGSPRQGQTLEQVKDLILAEVEKVKRGEFDDWMLTAVINNLRLNRIREFEGNQRTGAFIETFANGTAWENELRFLDELETVTKQQIMDFATKNYNNNYVIVYKRTGDAAAVKVDKPTITPPPLNRDNKSVFMEHFEKTSTPRLSPQFLDFNTDIQTSELKKGVQLHYIPNKTNELFELYYIVEMGKLHDLKIPLAVNYLPYLGTNKYSAPDLQKEFFKLGIEMNVFASNNRCYVYLSGLEKSMKQGVDLLEHVLANVQPDDAAYQSYVDGIIKERADRKLNKGAIMSSAISYAKFGAKSAATHLLSEQELRNVKPSELTDLIKGLYGYEHRILYYGQSSVKDISKTLSKSHVTPKTLKKCTTQIEFPEQPTDQNRVFFIDYNMVQASIYLLSRDQIYDPSLEPGAELFGQYFGAGLSSVVFQEIRESKALAYSAYSFYSTPARKQDSNYLIAFVGTQADKMSAATAAMTTLLNNMPEAPIQYEAARDGVLKQIESERITKTNIFWTYMSNRDLGLDYDLRRDIYNKVKTMDMTQFKGFFDAHIKNKTYHYVIMGDKKLLDRAAIEKLGPVKDLTLEEIFNY